MFAAGTISRVLIILSVFSTAVVLVRADPESGLVDPGDDSLRLYAVNIELSPSQSWIAYITYRTKRFIKLAIKRDLGPGGVYLGEGLVITAAHVIGSDPAPRVRILGEDLPAEVVKKGKFEDVDLALLRVDQEKLPIKLRLRRMPLCRKTVFGGLEVVVATPVGVARSSVISAAQLPAELRRKFSTDIKDVATTGNSGSGVFDAERKCLLGVVSRKIVSPANGLDAPERDIAKYFVPAPTIAEFISDVYRAK